MAGLARHAIAERHVYAPHGNGYGVSSRAPSPAILDSGMVGLQWAGIAAGATASGNNGVADEVMQQQQQQEEEAQGCKLDLNLRL